MIMIWLLFLILVLFLYVRREGFDTPTTLSSKSKEGLTKYLEDNHRSVEQIATIIKTYESAGVTDSNVDTFLTTKKWPWTQSGINVLTKYAIYTKIPSDSITTTLDAIQSTNPEQVFMNQMAVLFGRINIANLQSTSKIGCKVEKDGTSSGDTMYLLDDKNVITDPIENDQLPTKIPGFQFLSNSCNPCSIMNSKFDCPFAIPGPDKLPILPNPILLYKWGIYPDDSTSLPGTNTVLPEYPKTSFFSF